MDPKSNNLLLNCLLKCFLFPVCNSPEVIIKVVEWNNRIKNKVFCDQAVGEHHFLFAEGRGAGTSWWDVKAVDLGYGCMYEIASKNMKSWKVTWSTIYCPVLFYFFLFFLAVTACVFGNKFQKLLIVKAVSDNENDMLLCRYRKVIHIKSIS